MTVPSSEKNGNVLIARFVARKRRRLARDVRDGRFRRDGRVEYRRIGARRVRGERRPGKAYHDLGRGVAFVNFVTGDFSRSTARSARLKRDRFFAHGAVALAAWFCFGFGTLVSAFFKTVFQNENEDGSSRTSRRKPAAHCSRSPRSPSRSAKARARRARRSTGLGATRRTKKRRTACAASRSCFASPRRWRRGVSRGERRRSRGETRRKKRGRRRDVACHRDDRGARREPCC